MVNEMKKFGQFVMCETVNRLDKFMMKFGQIVLCVNEIMKFV